MEKKQQISMVYRIIHCLYLENKEITIKHVMKSCNLKYNQVVGAIRLIKPMGILAWRYEEVESHGYKHAPRGKIFMKIKDPSKNWVRKKLEERELL